MPCSRILSMPRKLRIEYAGAIYHVTVRGNQRQLIFQDDHDRKRLLQRLGESIEDYVVRLYLYCLMPNHMHFVLETPRSNLSRFMQSCLTGYTVYYNQRHKQSGHLFHGRYGAKLVQGDKYLLALSRYVHLNPVYIEDIQKKDLKTRIQYMRDYIWSSYRAYIGMTPLPAWLTNGPVMSGWSAVSGWRACAAYRRYIEGGLAETDEEFEKLMKNSGPVLGSDDFRNRVQEMADEKQKHLKCPEDAEFRWEQRKLSADEILEKGAEYFGWQTKELQRRSRGELAKTLAAKLLGRYSGLTNREIAPLLGLRSGAAVAWQRRRAEEVLNGNFKLLQQWKRLVQELDQISKAHA